MNIKDDELSAVRAAFEAQREGQLVLRTAAMLRDTIDQLLDGVHTGRWQWSALHKTEKTHAGTLVEINFRREFKDFITDGRKLDYGIAGVDVDCKFSQDEFGWMFPPESIDEICVVMWASDEKKMWSMGLLRVRDAILGAGKGNRDHKRSLRSEARDAIVWIARREALPSNVYLDLPHETAELILDANQSGQERILRLFRFAQRRLIGRAAVATAGMQDDYMKRVRYNGGARSRLQAEGIVILGHEHQGIAGDLGLPVPAKGQFVSATIVPAASATPKRAMIEGARWALGESAVGPAPRLPRG